MDNNDNMQSTLIKVQSLEKEYNAVLNQYNEAQKNYINVLNQSTIGSSTEATFNPGDYTALPNSTWWGTTGLKEGPASTQEECESMCATSAGCSGATFNPVSRYCWARGGDGNVVPGSDSDYALLPKKVAALSIVKSLNERLLSLNNEMSTELKNINPKVQEQQDEKVKKQQELNTYYQHLIEQKIEMERQIQDYNSINENNENQELYVDQGNITYNLWILLTIFLLVLVFKNVFNLTGGLTFGLGLLGLVIIMTFSLSTPSGFLAWFLLVMGIILMKSMTAK